MKKIGSLFLVLVLAFSILNIPVDAANKAQISYSTQRSKGTQYETTSTFTVGEKIYVPITFQGIPDVKVGGFACKIEYNSDALTFSSNTWTTVNDKDAVFYTHDKNGTVTLLWDTVSNGTVFDGTIFYVVFESKEDISEDTDLKFSIQVDDFYELSAAYPNILFEVESKTLTAQIVVEGIPQTVLEAMQQLKTISASQESLDCIVDAEMQWGSLTANQQKSFVKQYAQEYEWFSTARNRYNKAVEQAGVDAINQQVKDFKTTYAEVLALSTETVTLQNAEAVAATTKAYEILPTSVTTRLPQEIPKLLKDLGKRIEDLEEAKAEAEIFIKDYGACGDITEAMLTESFTTFEAQITEAMLMYDMLPEDAKPLVADLYGKLSALQKKCEEIIATNEELKAISDEVNAYQRKWLKVFTLNAGNVSLEDKTAIEMAISDYASLSKPAQEALSSKITMLKSLLERINSQRDDNSVQSGATDDSTVVQTQTKEKIVEKEVLVKITEYLSKAVPKVVWILLALFLTAILTLLFPLIMTLYYKKNKKKFQTIHGTNVGKGESI